MQWLWQAEKGDVVKDRLLCSYDSYASADVCPCIRPTLVVLAISCKMIDFDVTLSCKSSLFTFRLWIESSSHIF